METEQRRQTPHPKPLPRGEGQSNTAGMWLVLLVGRRLRLGGRLARCCPRTAMGASATRVASGPCLASSSTAPSPPCRWPKGYTPRHTRGLRNAGGLDSPPGLLHGTQRGPEVFAGTPWWSSAQPLGYRRVSAATDRVCGQGGKLVRWIDSPENRLEANRPALAFRLSIHHDRAWKGKLSTTRQAAPVEHRERQRSDRGQPLGNSITPGGRRGQVRQGRVMAVGFGSL